MTRRLSPDALRQAAQIARQEGVTVTVERKADAWVYRIAPVAQDGAADDLIELRDLSRN